MVSLNYYPTLLGGPQRDRRLLEPSRHSDYRPVTIKRSQWGNLIRLSANSNFPLCRYICPFHCHTFVTVEIKNISEISNIGEVGDVQKLYKPKSQLVESLVISCTKMARDCKWIKPRYLINYLHQLRYLNPPPTRTIFCWVFELAGVFCRGTF